MIHPPERPTDAAVPRLALPPGYILGDYRIEGVLGKGGFGITYLARDVTLDMPVAIKEMLPDGIATRVGGSQVVAQTHSLEESFAWARQRFLEEARMLARLNHRNIVRVQRMLEANGTAYMVMEYVEGQGFDDWLRQNPRMTESQLLGIILPLLEGLEHVHSHGMLHRDIKPENIFITREGRVLLLDFGSARMDAAGRTTAMTTVVSEGYSPLEQYQTKSTQGPYTDIYSLAAVMARAITGARIPNPLERHSDVSCFQPLALRRLRGWNPSLLHAVDAGLAIMPRDRMPSIAEFRRLLGSPPPLPAPTSLKGRLPVIGGVLAAILIAALVIARMFPDAPTSPGDTTTPNSPPSAPEVPVPVAPAPSETIKPPKDIARPKKPSLPPATPALAVTPTSPAPTPAPAPASPAPPAAPVPAPVAPLLPLAMSGTFTYGSGYGMQSGNQVSFTLTLGTSNFGRFSGTIEEPYSGFGTPVRGKLHAEVTGTLTTTGGRTRVTFTKTYRHFSQDSVQYDGTLDPTTGRITGTWTFPGQNLGGTFSLAPRS